jgi:hypothetical protein
LCTSNTYSTQTFGLKCNILELQAFAFKCNFHRYTSAATSTGASNPEIAKKIKYLKNKVRPSSLHVPAAKPAKAASSRASKADKRDPGPRGDPEWLATAKSPSQPIHVRIGAVNKVGGWLAAHLERVLKRPAGESEWFFEDKEVVAFLDAGVVGAMLDVLTHTVGLFSLSLWHSLSLARSLSLALSLYNKLTPVDPWRLQAAWFGDFNPWNHLT